MIGRVSVVGSTVAITQVGFGCARIYGGSELRRSTRLIDAALSAGIRHFDTAPSYGGGQSEEVLGEALSGMKDVTLTTKIGIERKITGVARSPMQRGYRQFVKPLLTRVPGLKSKLMQLMADKQRDEFLKSAPLRKLENSYIRRELEASLKRLKRDRVDLYLIHEPDQFALDEEALESCTALMREGLIGAFGLAYGRSTSTVPDFGAVNQSQYCGYPDSQENGKRTRIFHGILRHGWHNSKTESGRDVGRYFKNVLEANPNVAIVFSATSTRQIQQLTTAI